MHESRRFIFSTITLTLLLTLSMLLGFLSIAPTPSLAQDTTVIGVGSTTSRSYEFVSQLDQTGLDLTVYGYLSHIDGLNDDLVFTKPRPDWNEKTARFTMYGTGTLTSRQEHKNLISTVSDVLLTIYYNESPGATFDDPVSFAKGTIIATFTVRYHHILVVRQPDVGHAMGSGESVQQKSTPFTLDGKQYTFGSTNLLTRITSFGDGLRTEKEAPQAQFVIAGDAVVLNPVQKGAQ